MFGRRSFVAVALAGLLAVFIGTPVVAAPPPPANDNFANATVITAIPYSKRVNTTSATGEGGDPAATCGSGTIGHNVWFAFTPGTTETLEATTEGSRVSGGDGFDTLLAVFTFDGSFHSVACDDDSGTNALSSLGFTATSGTTYYFQVGTYGSNTYNHSAIKFNLGPPTAVLEAVVGAQTGADSCNVHVTGSGLMAASNVYYNYGSGNNVLGTVAGDGTFDNTSSYVEQTYTFSSTTGGGNPIDTGSVVVFCH